MKNDCILAGIDLGSETERIVSYAAYFAEGTRVPVRLLYVIDYLLTPPAYLMPYIEEEKKRDEAEMKRWQAVLAQGGISSDSHIMIGRLHESFERAIEEYSPRLLVIGHKTHVLRPSSSERLIKSLAMPMLVVRGKRSEGTAGSAAVKKILCAVDFSDNAKKALEKASEFARAFSADLRVVHVVPSHQIREQWDRWEQHGKDNREKFEGDMRAEAEAALSGMIREAGLPSGGDVLQGDPAKVACSYADEGGYDLIVMGARGLSYIKGIFIGSTTESVLRSSPCPVLIVH
jgi:nucleotide-binding universal stress UspA family protein